MADYPWRETDRQRAAAFPGRLDRYRERLALPAEGEDIYDPQLPPPEWYRELAAEFSEDIAS